MEAEHYDPLTEDGWPTEGYDETSYFPHEGEEEEYNPFEGIQGLEGCSLTGLSSALPKQRTVVTPTERQLALWRQARGGAVMDPRYKIDILEKIYSGDPAAKPFLDQEIPVEVPTTLRCQTADMVLRGNRENWG